MTEFRNRVLNTVRQIPSGQAVSYKKVAELSGSPRAYRAVGNIMRKNNDSKIPCHRVIRSDKTPGGYSLGGTREKELRLTRENARLDSGEKIKYTIERNLRG